MHYILFPVGDWSCDGHNCFAEFIVQSHKPLQDVREIHFKENSFFEQLCSDYEDNKIPVFNFYSFFLKYTSSENAQNIIKSFIEKGLTLTDEELEFQDLKSKINHEQHNYKISLSFHDDPENIQSLIVPNPTLMLDVWISCLNIMEPSLNLSIVSAPMSQQYIQHKGYPFKHDGSINFFGFDSQDRHLNTPGYGVWIDLDNEFNNS